MSNKRNKWKQYLFWTLWLYFALSTSIGNLIDVPEVDEILLFLRYLLLPNILIFHILWCVNTDNN